MRKLLFLLLVLSVFPALLSAQSTTLSGTITDLGGQSWNNGTYTFTFVPGNNITPPVWTGGAFNPLAQVTGTMNGSGVYSQSLPSNSAITPINSYWRGVFCTATNPQVCATSNFVLTQPTQTGNVTPPIPVIPAGLNYSVYATGEVGNVSVGASIYVIGTGLQTCSAITGGAYIGICSQWNNSAGMSGNVSTGTQCFQAVYTASAAQLGPTTTVCDASAFYTGSSTWTQDVVSAYGSSFCATSCVIVIPNIEGSHGSGAATTPVLPDSVSLQFAGGSNNFTFCALRAGAFSKITGTGNAQLVEAGSSCPGVEWINNTPSLQSNDHPALRDLIINCSSQTTSTGVTLNSSGGSALFDFENLEVTGCTTVGIIANKMQFSHWRNIHAQQNYVNVKLYSGSGGGVSSNTFDGLSSQSPNSGVGVIVYNTATVQVQTGNRFINPQLQGGGVVALAVIGATGATQPQVVIDGGSPELNGPAGTSPGSSITIDGNVITQAGAAFISNGLVFWNQPDIEDATASPEFLVTNNSTLTIKDLFGYGNTSGNICQADTTSFCNLDGAVATVGLANGLNFYPKSLSSTGVAGFKMIGTPNIYYTNQMPNMLNNANGSAMYAPYSSFGTGASGVQCLDPIYGAVNCMSFAASAGTDCSSNCVSFGNLLASALGATNDIFVSFIAKAATAGSFQFYGGGSNGSAIVATVPTTWTRYIIYLPNQASNTNFPFHIIPKDSTGTTLSMTALEIVQYPAQSATSQQYISLALTGATGTALAKAPTISSGFGTSPSVVTYEWLSPSEVVFTVNVGTGGSASSGVIGFAQPPNGFNCYAFDLTNPTTGGGYNIKQTAQASFPYTTTFTGYNTSGTATAWTASDILRIKCSAY